MAKTKSEGASRDELLEMMAPKPIPKETYVLKIKVTLIESALGMRSPDLDAIKEYLAPRSEDSVKIAQEIKDAEITKKVTDEAEPDERPITIFPRNTDGIPYCYDYHWKAYMKETCSSIRKMVKEDSSGRLKKQYRSGDLTAHNKTITGNIFVEPRHIPITLPNDSPTKILTRPLRAQTAQGERITIASSEMIPPGSTMEFNIRCMSVDYLHLVREWLDRGKYSGTFQWRGGGYGRFIWEELGCEIEEV